MSLIGSQFGNLPGISPMVETFEAAITWGPAYQLKWWNGYINPNAVDAGNSPTYRLRPGLLLGQNIATGQWSTYSPTASDGTEVASGILAYGVRMQDVLSGQNVAKFFAIVIGGNIKSANIIGLDQQARAQMAGRFTFDDNLSGALWYPWKRQIPKTANYSILASDNFTVFNNAGATGAVTFTLPPITNGLEYGFSVQADQNLLVTSFEGANIVAFNNLVANTIALQTAGSRVGGSLVFYTNPAGTKWILENNSAGANTVTVS
jgi:hypothetical protein